MKRALGRSKIEVSALGMGCWAIGGPWTWTDPGRSPAPAGWGQVDDAESIRAIHAAIDHGVNFFDTAANYGAGHSEVVLGQALVGRPDVIVATKFGHIVDEDTGTVHADDGPVVENIRRDVDNSRRRLQREVIDLYQFHVGDFDPETSVQVRETLEDLVTEGKIRWYGWSTDSPDRARVFAEGAHCSAVQFRLNLISDNPEMREVCQQHGLAGINKDPLNKGVLTGKFSPTSTFPKDDLRSRVDWNEPTIAQRLRLVEELRPILTDDGRTMAQGALAYIWATDPNMIPIPGIRTPSQAIENAGSLRHGPMPTDQKAEIDRLLGRSSPFRTPD